MGIVRAVVAFWKEGLRVNQEEQRGSIAALAEKVTSSPDNVEFICDLADVYADQGRWGDAIEAYKAAIALDSTNADLQNSLGTVYEEAGKLVEAEQAYQKAIALSPEDPMAYYNSGAMYEEQRRITEAIQAYEKCLRYSTDPDERSEVKKRLTSLTSETSTGQSRLAYRLAAVALFVGVIVNFVDGILGSNLGLKIIPIVIDTILVIGLIQLRVGARTYTLVRSAAGAILGPIWTFAQNAPTTVVIVTVIAQWGYCGTPILLLTGESKTWRLALAVGIYVVFFLGTYAVLLLLVVLAKLAGL